MTIQLGNIVRDTVTDLVGTATSRVEYLNGCIQYAVLPKVGADNKIPEAYYIDHQRLEFVDDGVAVKRSPTGGPQRDTPSASYRG